MNENNQEKLTGQISDEKSKPPQKTTRRYFRLLRYLVFIASLVIVLVVLYGRSNLFMKKEKIRLVGGSPKLTFHWVMIGIDSTLQKEFKTEYHVTNGAEENLKLLCNNKADIGLTHANLPHLCDGITAIANVFCTTLHIISTRKSDVKKITDIKSWHRVAIGPEGSGTAILADRLLKFYGLHYNSVNVHTFEEEQQLLENGQIDVAFLFGGKPILFITELRKKQNYQLVDIINPMAFICNVPYLVEDTIGKGFYGENPIFPNRDITTLKVPSLLIVSPKFSHKPRADKVIEKITRLIFENWSELPYKHPAIMLLNKNFATSNLAYPLHPGAKRYFSENKSDGPTSAELLVLVAYAMAVIAYTMKLLDTVLLSKRRR